MDTGDFLEFINECDYKFDYKRKFESLYIALIAASQFFFFKLTFYLQIISNYQKVANIKTGQRSLVKHLPTC